MGDNERCAEQHENADSGHEGMQKRRECTLPGIDQCHTDINAEEDQKEHAEGGEHNIAQKVPLSVQTAVRAEKVLLESSVRHMHSDSPVPAIS